MRLTVTLTMATTIAKDVWQSLIKTTRLFGSGRMLAGPIKSVSKALS